MRIIRKVEARCRVARAPTGIDPERPDLPVGRDGPDGEEEQEAKLPPAPPLFRLLQGRRSIGTPEWETHPAPTLSPGDYGACFACGRSAMPL
jgi:hypothetical protein